MRHHTGFELIGYHDDADFIKVSESICHWIQNVAGNTKDIDFSLESKQNFIDAESIMGKNIKIHHTTNIHLELKFYNNELYRLFQISIYRKEYEKYITSEIDMMSPEDFERWKNND